MPQIIPALPDSRTHDPYHSADDLGSSVIFLKIHFENNYKLTPSSVCGESEVNLIIHTLEYKFMPCQFFKIT